MGRSYEHAVFVLGPLAIFGGAAMFAVRGVDFSGLFFLVGGLALLAAPIISRRIERRQYSQRSEKDAVVTWEFFSDHLDIKTPASASIMEWKIISRAIRTPQGFLLYQSENVFFWLPVHAFRNPQDVEAFAELVESRVRQFDYGA